MRAAKHRLLSSLASFIIRHPLKIAAVSIILALLSLIYSFFFLQLDTDQDNLISKKIPYHQRYLQFLKEFGDTEYFFVVFEVPHGKEREAKQALLSLVDRVNQRPDLFSEILYQTNWDILKNRALLTLPEKEFQDMIRKLSQWKRGIETLGQTDNFISLIDFAADQVNQPLATLKKNADDLENGFALFQDILTGIDNPEAMASLSSHDFFQPIIGNQYHQDPEGFLFSRSGRLLYLLAMPAKDYSTLQVVEKPLQFLRDELNEVKQIFPDIPVGITGRPVLQADEVSSTGNDSLWASIASLAGVALLYILYLRNLRRPLLIIASLVCGISWTLGMITLTLGHLNLLTVIFAIILVGIGVDYGMHFLLRYLKERQKSQGVRPAIELSLTATGQGIVTSGLCTAAAFYTALFSDFLGLKELGFVAGTGVLFCLISQLTTLPALIYLFDRSPALKEKTIVLPRLTQLDWCLKKPGLTLIALGVATLWFFPSAKNLHFENNLLKLQDPNLESVRYEQKIIHDTGISSWFAAYVTRSKKELLEWQMKADRLKSVDEVESIYSLIPPDEKERVVQLNKLAGQLKLTSSAIESPSTAKSLLPALVRLRKALERLETAAFEGGEEKAVEKIDRMLDTTGHLIKKLENPSPSLENSIIQSQKIFFDFLADNKKILKNNLQPPSLDENELPPNIRRRYKSDAGNYVLYVYPRQNIWEESFMKKFVDELRSVSPLASGPPIGVYESAIRMKNGFVLIGILTMVLVTFFLLIDFRSLKDSAIALLPLVSGMVWLAAGMHFFDIPLSLANFFALPILIGLGIDNGVHLMHHYRDKGEVHDMLHTVAPAIILSTLTTLIGFGALSFVRHRGLASFGQIMSLGSMTCLVAALFVVPVVLKLVERKNKTCGFFKMFVLISLLPGTLYGASPFDYFNNRDIKIFPIPVFESRPDEGLTFGLMPVMVVSDKEDESIKAIMAAIGQYNSVTRFGGGTLAYLYPTADQEIEFFFEMSQRYARELSLRYFNPTLKEKIYLEGDFVYLKSPFGRFYGIGPDRIESNMSNYTSRNFNLDLTGGYLFFKNIRGSWTTRLHTTDLLNRAIEDIDDTLTRYGALPEVVDSTNWINEVSVTFDNRPEREYSKKGSMASLAYFFSNKKLGSDKNFQGWKWEALQLAPFIKNRLTTVFRFHLQEIFGEGVPFYELSSLGGENEFRAFTPGRFVDQGKIFFQIENRFRLFDATLFKKSFSIYLDPFFEVGRVFSSLSTIGFADWQPVGGLGLRLFVPPNIIGRLDAAIGSDGFEIYTQLGYPF